MPNKNKMKSLNLSSSQAQIVVKSLNERLYELDEELDVLESRIIEIRMKKSQLNNLLAELGGVPAGNSEGPKKRGRKPGSGKKAVSATATAAPKKRGRKPGSAKKAAATPAAPKKRGRKPGSAKKAAAKAAVKSAPAKRGRKPNVAKKASAKAAVKAAPAKRGPKPSAKKAAPKAAVKSAPAKRGPKPSAKKAAPKAAVKAAPAKRGPKPSVGAKAVQTKVAAIAPVAPAKRGVKAAAKKEAPVAAPASKAAKQPLEAAAKRGRKSGGENTLAAKIVSAISDAKKGLSTREIVDAINSKYGAEKDERKLIQAISSTLISLTKRGKIKRETTGDGQILNNVV